MLQRVQTLFLLAIILAMLVLFFVPIWSKVDPSTGHSYTIYAWHLKETNPVDSQIHLIVKPYIFIGILGIIATLTAFYALLRYDNRLRQLQLCALNSLLLTGMMGCMIYLATKNEGKLITHLAGHYKLGFIAGIVGVISNLLANQFIKRDERLVREAEKIR
jgi:glucan phosphoethanolaminetransferase (alkaline phosphatase superfamily)